MKSCYVETTLPFLQQLRNSSRIFARHRDTPEGCSYRVLDWNAAARRLTAYDDVAAAFAYSGRQRATGESRRAIFMRYDFLLLFVSSHVQVTPSFRAFSGRGRVRAKIVTGKLIVERDLNLPATINFNFPRRQSRCAEQRARHERFPVEDNAREARTQIIDGALLLTRALSPTNERSRGRDNSSESIRSCETRWRVVNYRRERQSIPQVSPSILAPSPSPIG